MSWRTASAAGRAARRQPRRAVSRAGLLAPPLRPRPRPRLRAVAPEPGGGTKLRRRPRSRGWSRRRPSASSRPSGCRGLERSPTIPWMSRAVPSPPAKRIRLTPRRRSSAAAARVSAALVATSTRPDCSTTVSRPCEAATSAPISSGAARTCSSGQRPSRASARPARSAAMGVAPRARAWSTTPSVPLRPTRPPMPAIGLTIKPRGSESVPSLRSSAATSSTARRTVPTISSSSSSEMTNGGAKEIESEAGRARVITPSSRQRRVTRAETFPSGSNGRGASGRRRTRALRSARSPGSRPRAGDPRTPPESARA